MFKKIYKVLPFGLSICIMLMCVACSSTKNATSKSNEQIAQEFSKLWIKRWNELPEEEKEMRLPQGKIFLEDLNGDETPELFLITPEWRDTAVVAFDIGKEPITEIGSFRGTEEDETVFSVFDGENGKVLHSESCLITGFANPTIPITDYYIAYDGKNFETVELYRVETKDGGETKYFESPYDNTEITSSEYDQRRKKAEKNGQPVKEIVVSGEDIEFLVGDNLQTHVLSLLDQWETENNNEPFASCMQATETSSIFAK